MEIILSPIAAKIIVSVASVIIFLAVVFLLAAIIYTVYDELSGEKNRREYYSQNHGGRNYYE